MMKPSHDSRRRSFGFGMVLALIAGAVLLLEIQGLVAPPQTRAVISETPVGTVVAFAGRPDQVPSNWLICDGRKLSATDLRYRSLFNAIGTAWGGTGTTFYLPDLRGRFVRGVDKDATGTPSAVPRDPDRDQRAASNSSDPANPGNSGNEVGSMQDDAMQNHKHLDSGHTHAANVSLKHDPIGRHEGEEVASGRGARVNGNEGNMGFVKIDVTIRTLMAAAAIGDPSESNAGIPRVGGDTRAKNAYVYWIIRYR